MVRIEAQALLDEWRREYGRNILAVSTDTEMKDCVSGTEVQSGPADKPGMKIMFSPGDEQLACLHTFLCRLTNVVAAVRCE